MSCIFCKIAAGENPAKVVYEDDNIIAFHDIAPQSATHILVIPKKHIVSAADIKEDDKELLGHIWAEIPKIARKIGVADAFKILTNSGKDAGQTVFHLHYHLMSEIKS